MIELVHTIQLPVVCSVRGWAVGIGCNLALAADFTVAATDAVFWEPFVDRGFSPDSGSTWLLPRLVGVARARRMLLLGEKVSATDAADWGLIHQAVTGPSSTTTAEELLARLACGPTVAIGLAKQALELRSACDPEPVHDAGAVQLRIILSNKRFQRRPGSLSAAARAGVSGSMTR